MSNLNDKTWWIYPSLHAALHLNSWDAYALGETRVIRSPDRRLYILHDYCSPQDCLALINTWQPLPLEETGH